MRGGSYRGLRLDAEVIPNEDHNSGAMFGRSLRALYPPGPPAAPRVDVCASR